MIDIMFKMNGKHSNPAKLILPFYTIDTLRNRIGWIINIRWIELFGVLVAIPISQRVLHLPIAYPQLYTISAIVLGFNLIYFFLFRYFPFRNFQQELTFTEIQLILDLIIISFLVHYIGGISNPFFFIYMVAIIISGVLLPLNLPYVNAAIAVILLTIWTILEYHRIVPVYPISEEPLRLSVITISLGAFYILIFTTTFVIKDFITGYRQLKRLVDEKSRQLENTMQERDKIFRFTAHELKSPITTLRSMLAVIEEVYSSKLNDEVADMLNRAVMRTDQILLMVKDMIDVTQYHHGSREKVIEEVNFEDWIETVTTQFYDYAEQKNISIAINKQNKEEMVRLDTPAIEKVLANLINNAIRYSPPNSQVTVTPFVKRNVFGFAVQDAGIGISKEDQTKIFEEFYRGKNARELERLGSGLGLPLVKQIVEQYQGNIFVESELEKGSTFTIEMPKIPLAIE